MSEIDFDSIARKYSSNGRSQFSQDTEEKKNKEVGNIDFNEIASRRKSQGQSVTSSWEPPLERNIVGETAAALGRGVGTAIEMTGRGIQQVGAESAGEKLREAGEAVQDVEFLAPSAELEAGEAGIVRRTLAGAAESIPMSAVPIATGIAGAAAGAATTVNPIGAAIGGLVGGAAGLGTVFYGGTYSAEKERALKEFETIHPDWTPEQREQEASSFAHKQALWETGTEGVSDLIMAGIGKAVAKGVAKEGVAGAKSILRDLIGSGGPKEMAKKFAQVYAGEGGPEIVAYLGQAANEQAYGLGDGPTLTGTLDTAMTSLWMTGVFGAAGAGMNYKERERTVSGLNSENKLIRDRAARKVEERVAKELGPEQAAQWRTEFESSVERGEGGNFSIDSPLFGAATEAYEKEGDSVLGKALGSVVDTETEIDEPQENLRPLYDQLQADVESLASQRETTDTPISEEEQKALDRASIMLATEQEERASSDKKQQLPDDLQGIDSMSRKQLIEVAKKYNIPTGKSNLGKHIKESVTRFADNYKEQEGYAKEELEAGQAAQAAEETGTRAGEGKLPPIGSLAGVVDFNKTSLDELQGIVRKVQETPFEQLTAQERKVADAIGVVSGGQSQPAPGGQNKAQSPEAKAVTGQVQGDITTFSEQSGTLGVPRAEMPQITSEQRVALANNLRSKGIEYTRTERAPRDLKPSQAEFSPEKVQQAREYTGPERAILVSKDGHVIDGHHQWMQKLEDAPNDQIPVIELGGNAQDVIQAVREFPSATTADGAKTGSEKEPEGSQPGDAGADGKGGDGSRDTGATEFPNKRAVETALRRGEDVSQEVMDQYPELAPASPEDISGKEGVTERLGSVMREEGKGKAGVRRELGGYRFDPKKFHEQRRNPEKLRLLTDNPEYKRILPENTEKIISEAAKIKQQVKDAEASLEDNKAHLVRFFDKEGVEEFKITHNGLEYKLTKPVGGETEVLTPEGKDAKEELYKDYQESGKLKYIAEKGVGLTIQPKKTPVSKVAPYATKTFEQAAREHIDFVAELAEAKEKETIIKARILDQIAAKLPSNGMDHVFRNKESDTAFNIKRNRRSDYFIHPENGAEFDRIKVLRDEAFYSGDKEDLKKYENQLKELIDPDIKNEVDKKVKVLKKAPGTGATKAKPLSAAGVQPQAARGFKGKGARGKAAEARAAAEAELDQILKSISGTPLPQGQRADIMGELTRQLGRGVLAQQKRGVFEVVSPERAAQAVATMSGLKKSMSEINGIPVISDIENIEQRLIDIFGEEGENFQDIFPHGGYGVGFRGIHPNQVGLKELPSSVSNVEGFDEEMLPGTSVVDIEGDIGYGAEEYFNEDNDVRELIKLAKSYATSDYVAVVVGERSGPDVEKNDVGEEVLIDAKAVAYIKVSDIEAKYSKNGQRIEGLTFPDGRVWLVDGNIEKGTASGVFAHELGVHARKLGFKDEKSFQAILNRIEALSKTDEQVKAARSRVPDNTPAQNVNEETLAYLVSDAQQHGLVKRLISSIKKFLAERGWFRMTLDKLTPSDLQALAQSAVRADMPAVTRATAGVNEFAQSVKMSTAKDGKTSTASVEAGEKAIQSIMETLRKVTQKTEAELDKSKAKEKKLLDQYRKLSSGLDAMPIDESVNLLNGLVRQADIPDGSRKRIGQLIKSITSAKRPETQRKRLDIVLDKLRSDISNRLRSQVRAQVKRAAGPRREGVIKRGRYWHEQEKDITSIREIVYNMSPEQATQSIVRVESRLGRSKLRAVKEAWQQEIDRKTNWLAQEITGQDDPRTETVAQKNRRKQKEKSLVGRAKGAYQAVENSIQSWEHLLDRITIKSGKKIFQSRAVKELGSMAHAATRGAERYNRETTDQMLAKGLEIFGVKKGSTLTKRLQKLAKKTGKIKVAGDALQLSPMEAAYFYNVRKEPGSEKLFKKMGFTPETWSGIDSLMTKELKAWADYLHDDLLADALNGETEAYRAVNGVDRVPVGLFRDDQTDIPVMNLNSAIMNRIFDANHYRAWAVPSKTFNDLFSVPETRGYIEQYTGTSTLKALDKFLEDFAKTPRELRGDMAWMDKLRSNVVMSMIGANPTTFFKQLTSIPAYAADIPTAAFVKNFAHGLANFGAVQRMIKDSQMARERFGSGYDRDIHEASKATAEQVIGGKITNMRNLLMAMTKLGDMAAVYAGYTVYKYHYDKNGGSKNHKEAHRIGIEEFERATERTQQAAGVKDRGSFERGSSLQKLLTMYMTSPAAYTRQTMAALRHFKTDPVGSSKRLLLFNVMLPMAFQAVASGFVGASGEDDEQWEEFWAKELRAVALGPFLGLPIARDIAAGLWDSAMGEWYGSDVQHSPVTETTKSLTQAVFHASKGLREFDDEAIEKAKSELLDFLGYAAGLPIKPGRRMQEGLEDFLSGDTEHPGLALAGYSRAARDERYLGD